MNSAEKIGNLMAQARGSLSQEYMAGKLGVSRSTVRKWEAGKSMPSLDKVFDWYDAAGVSIVPALLRYLYPSLFDGKQDSDDACKTLLHTWVDEVSPAERKSLAYLISCEWGGSFVALLQLMLAHASCGMRSRISHAALIRHSYQLEKEVVKGRKLPVEPQIDILETAYRHGVKSLADGIESYVGGMEVAEGEIQKR